MFTATPQELQAWCFSGDVIDCKTLIGAMWLQNVQSGEWTLTWKDGTASPLAVSISVPSRSKAMV